MAEGLKVQGREAERDRGVVGSPVDVVLAGGLALVGGLGFLAVFRGEDLSRPVVVAAVVGSLVSLVVSGGLRRGTGFSGIVAAGALGVGAVVVCGAAPGGVVPGLVDGPWTILTSAVPVRADAEVLVVPFAVTGAAALLGAEIAQRSHSALAPVLPGLVALVLGLLLGVDDRLPPAWVPTAWAGLALVTTGWRTSRAAARTVVTARSVTVEAADDPRRPRGAHASRDGEGDRDRSRPSAAHLLRAGAVAALVALPVAVVAREVAPHLPGAAGERDRFALRELVDEPVQPEPLTNPLVEVTALQSGPDDRLFVAETSGAVERWRLAVLDTYDGREWRSHGAFLPAGVELPGPPDGEGDDGRSGGSGDDGEGDGGEGSGRRVSQRIEPSGLDGLWLPVADRVTEIETSRDLLFDAATGVLLVDGRRLPRRYEAVSVVPRHDAARLSGATAATDEQAQAARPLPADLPGDVRTLAEQVTQGAASDYQRAVALERYLAAGEEGYRLAQQELPSGHTLGHLRCLLFDTETCAQRGSTEQFVAAFALLARTAGLPTRVVVGFEGVGSAGRDPVTAHEATAWAEVRFEGVGWVAFDPVPATDVSTTPPTTALPGSGGAPNNQPATTLAPDTANQPPPDQDGEDDAADESSSSSTVLLVLGLAVVAVALVLLPGALRATRRRRRRRAPSAAARVAGAWAAAVDEIRRGGVPLGRGLAVTDVVRASGHRFAGAAEPLVPLGLLVNRVKFGRGEPAEPEAEQAWQLSDAFAARRRKGRPAARRLREYFSFR